MFKIGEFSKLAQVSIHLLRHYDRVGLFAPIKIDPFSGYRYYSVDQLPRLNQILALREMGISLEQINDLLEKGISSDEMHSMLRLRQSQVEQTLEEEAARLLRIQSRIELLNLHQQDALNNPILLKEVPAQHFLSIREVAPSLKDMGILFSLVFEAVKDTDIAENTYCQSITHSEQFTEFDVDWELGFAIHEPNALNVPLTDGRCLTVRELEPIPLAATLVYAGTWQNSVRMFQMAGKWIEANQYEIAGSFREVYLSFDISNEIEVIFELQIPLKQ